MWGSWHRKTKDKHINIGGAFDETNEGYGLKQHIEKSLCVAEKKETKQQNQAGLSRILNPPRKIFEGWVRRERGGGASDWIIDFKYRCH